MTMQAVIECAWRAGFPRKYGATMGAIAKRESGLDPTVHNGNAQTGDDSYGLWQINWLVPQVKALLTAHGITDPRQLLDPDTNAKAAFLLWGGKLENLNTAWYINRVGIYQTRYESHLPEAQAAALSSSFGN